MKDKEEKEMGKRCRFDVSFFFLFPASSSFSGTRMF